MNKLKKWFVSLSFWQAWFLGFWGTWLAVMLIAGLTAQAQTPTGFYGPYGFTNWQQLTPVTVPTSPTAVWTRNVYMELVTFTSASTAGACTVVDGNGNAVLNAVPLAANTVYVMDLKDRWMPGGVTWSCTASGVIGYMRAKW